MILVIGPYIGDFEQEVLTFRPWARWLYEQTRDLPEFNKVYIHTHFNRFFMYKDFLDNEFHVPIYENLSRDEIGQQEYIHGAIDSRDYNILIKNIKEIIVKKEGCNKKDIQIEHLNYAKYMPHTPIYKKLFSKIHCEDSIETEYTDKVVFIPTNTGDKEEMIKVKDSLTNFTDFVIIGDKKCRFKDDNIILNRVDYIENGFRLLVKIITEARAVVCPLSFWTTICNLQQTPVFSWGPQVGQHKEGGVYYFGNKNCWAIPDSNMNTTLKMIEYFLKEIFHG